jgi:peptidyl-prolyl cis-trans isomerase C
MKSTIKTFGVLLATAALAAATLSAEDTKPAAATAPAAPATNKSALKINDLLPDIVIAKGKNLEIKRSELDEVVGGLKASASANGQEIPPAQLPMLERELLDGLLQMRLLNAKATDVDKVKGKMEADTHYEAIKKQAPSEEALNMKLKSVGLTPEKLLARLTEEATAQAVLRAKVTVSDADVKKFYDENPSKFEQPEMVRASHILIGTKDKAGTDMSETQKAAKKKEIEGILKRARDGEDFAKLAKEFSEDPGSKDKGGEYKFPRGQMVPEFEAAAFSLKTNQISDVVTTAYGYHIIKLSEKIPAQRVEFAKVSTDIKAYLEKKEIEKILPAYYAQLKKEGGVEILDPKLKALEEAAAAEAAMPKPEPGQGAAK